MQVYTFVADLINVYVHRFLGAAACWNYRLQWNNTFIGSSLVPALEDTPQGIELVWNVILETIKGICGLRIDE